MQYPTLDQIVDYWRKQKREKESHLVLTVPTRFERIAKHAIASSKTGRNGDALVRQIRSIFFHGLGVKWAEHQIKVFNAFLFAAMPLVYGEEWGENKSRILSEWGSQREQPYCVVSMARRNGKTFVVSGIVVAFMLVIPVKIAIFSICKRASMMMMSEAIDRLEKAFTLGTHCNRQDFTQITKNTECVIYEGPDKTKRIIGSFPGSSRVSLFSSSSSSSAFFLCIK